VERGLKQADNRNAQSTARRALVGEASERGRVELDREANERSRGGEVRPASLSEEPAIVSAANGENDEDELIRRSQGRVTTIVLKTLVRRHSSRVSALSAASSAAAT